MAKIALPPRKEEGAKPKGTDKAKEMQISKIINKGSSTKAERTVDDEVIKGFTIQILGKELNDINALRNLRPKSRTGKKAGISTHNWIVEAIQEKIAREKKEHGL